MPANNEIVRVSAGSTADVPETLAKEHHIMVVPGWITFGEKSIKDDPNLPLKDFFGELESSKVFPQTAAPGTEVFKEQWDKYNGSILPITAGDKLSGFYNAAVLARNDLRMLHGEERRTNILPPWNSLNISLGEGFPAIIAAEMLEKGIPIGEVLKELDKTRERMHVFAFAKSTEFFGRSGKISEKKAFMGRMLGIKPCVIAYNNEILPYKNYSTYRTGMADLAEFAATHGPINRMAVVYTGKEEIGQQMIQAIEKRNIFDTKDILVTPATKIVASHTGPDGFGLIFVGSPRQ